MRLVADASSLVASSLRRRRDEVIGHKNAVFYIAEPTWSETVHEIGRRLDAMVQHRQVPPVGRQIMLSEILMLLTHRLTIVPVDEYRQFEAAARARVPRDPNDWPTVAVAPALDAGIWTHDYDFFGCGIPVWSSETLLTHLDT